MPSAPFAPAFSAVIAVEPIGLPEMPTPPEGAPAPAADVPTFEPMPSDSPAAPSAGPRAPPAAPRPIALPCAAKKPPGHPTAFVRSRATWPRGYTRDARADDRARGDAGSRSRQTSGCQRRCQCRDDPRHALTPYNNSGNCVLSFSISNPSTAAAPRDSSRALLFEVTTHVDADHPEAAAQD